MKIEIEVSREEAIQLEQHIVKRKIFIDTGCDSEHFHDLILNKVYESLKELLIHKKVVASPTEEKEGE